ncbi:MAG: ArsR family transcriptional regulator [Candidatus Thorarchaeota archaeon]
MTLKVNDSLRVEKIAKALTNPTRVKILRLLSGAELSVTEVAAAINMTEANASAQINILLNLDLLECRFTTGIHGLKKLCRTKVKQITIDI